MGLRSGWRTLGLSAVSASICGLLVLGGLCAVAQAQPLPVPATYMYGTTALALEQNAYNAGCYFAQHQPGGNRVFMLDFGAARADPSGGGAIDFSDVYFSNPTILTALEAASNGVHNCYHAGLTEIAYGTNNSALSGMSDRDAMNAGYWQEQRANDLFNYQRNNGRIAQDAAAGSDVEPSWAGKTISNDLVNGASKAADAVWYDFGSADGCPTSGSGGACNNGWGTFDVAWASFSGTARPLPEIYYAVNAAQWAVIRRNWDAHKSGYYFAGSTGSTGVGLTPQQGWDDLSADNPGLVQRQPGTICFGC